MWSRWFRRRRQRIPKPQMMQWLTANPDAELAQPANDNCFWSFLLGPALPFEAANDIRQWRQKILDDDAFFIDAKLRLIDNCDTFLALFQAIHVEQNEAKAQALAPKLNRHIPELMHRCPIKALRPKRC